MFLLQLPIGLPIGPPIGPPLGLSCPHLWSGCQKLRPHLALQVFEKEGCADQGTRTIIGAIENF